MADELNDGRRVGTEPAERNSLSLHERTDAIMNSAWKKAAAGLLVTGLSLGATACDNEDEGTVTVTETQSETELELETETDTETLPPTETETETVTEEIATETGTVTETETEFQTGR